MMIQQPRATRRRFLAAMTATAGGIMLPGQIGLGADSIGKIDETKGAKAYDRGIFRCAPADLADPGKHTLLLRSGWIQQAEVLFIKPKKLRAANH